MSTRENIRLIAKAPLIFTGLLSADRRFPYKPDNECIRTSIGFKNQ